jgi:hypothetical protein
MSDDLIAKLEKSVFALKTELQLSQKKENVSQTELEKLTQLVQKLQSDQIEM